MIVISSALALAAAAAPASANHPVVGWQNVVTRTNVAADSETVDDPATNLANPITAAAWAASAAEEQYLTVTPGAIDAIDYLAVARHNFGSAAIAVSVEGRAGIDDDWTELVAAIIPANNEPLLFRWEPQSLAQVRLKMAEGSEAPSAAVLYVGLLLVLPRRVWQGIVPIQYGRTTEVSNGRAESGDFLGRIVLGESRTTAYPLNNIDPDWYRTEMDPFIQFATGAPFFFAWRPFRYPREIGYLWMTNDPQPVHQIGGYGYVSVDLQMGGLVS